MSDSATLTLAIGIILSMLWEKRTGWSCGGLIAPGVLALALYDFGRVAGGVLIALAVWAALELAVRRFGWYGRRRAGWAMLMALALRTLSGHISADPMWFGWVVPGLIAADMQRQGAIETLASLAVTSVMTGFLSEILVSLLAGGLW